MQTDPIQSLELHCVASIPLKQIEIDMKAKTPDASMLTIESTEEFQRKPTVPKELIEKIPSNDTLQNLIPNLNETLQSQSDGQKPYLYAVKRAFEMISAQKKTRSTILKYPIQL